MTKKTRPLIRLHNAETNEIIDREMNDEEFEYYSKVQQKKLAEQIQADEREIERQAILDRLGLTSAEAKLLLG